MEVFSTQQDSSGEPSVALYDVDTGELLTEDNPSEALSVGNGILCGLEIDTHGITIADELKEFSITLTINAAAPTVSEKTDT